MRLPSPCCCLASRTGSRFAGTSPYLFSITTNSSRSDVSTNSASSGDGADGARPTFVGVKDPIKAYRRHPAQPGPHAPAILYCNWFGDPGDDQPATEFLNEAWLRSPTAGWYRYSSTECVARRLVAGR